MLNGGPITWNSKKQSCIALSTSEAKYIALSANAQECVWLRQLLYDLGKPPMHSITLFEDNQSTIAMIKIHGFMEGQSTLT